MKQYGLEKKSQEKEYKKEKRGMNEYKEETTICLNRGKYNIENGMHILIVLMNE